TGIFIVLHPDDDLILKPQIDLHGLRISLLNLAFELDVLYPARTEIGGAEGHDQRIRGGNHGNFGAVINVNFREVILPEFFEYLAVKHHFLEVRIHIARTKAVENGKACARGCVEIEDRRVGVELINLAADASQSYGFAL